MDSGVGLLFSPWLGAGQELYQGADSESLDCAGDEDHAPGERSGQFPDLTADCFDVRLCCHVCDLAFQPCGSFFGDRHGGVASWLVQAGFAGDLVDALPAECSTGAGASTGLGEVGGHCLP